MAFALQTGIHTSLPIAALVWVLILASLTTALARHIHIPYIVALVVLGLAVSALGWMSSLRPTPDIILLVFLPPLLFEAALEIDVRSFGRTLPVVTVLAVPGVVITTIAVGLAVDRFTPLHLWPALVFGALIAATDPVSVVATFRQLGTPIDLSTMVESESLFNDGTALVLSSVLLSAAQTGRFDVLAGIVGFVWAVGAAIVLGAALSFGTTQVIRRLDDPAVETTLSMALAYGTFLLASRIGASGAVAVVVGGLIYGSYGRTIGLTGESRRSLDAFWEYVGFLANAVLFVLIGLEIRVNALWQNARWILVAIAAVLAIRAVLVYLLTWRLHRIPWNYGHVVFWGGLRGGVAVAIALSLPVTVPGRDLILALTFGVVLFTVLVQGLTIDPLVRRLGLVSESSTAITS